jgi:hypothetical protein
MSHIDKMVGRLYGSLKKIVSRFKNNFFVQENLLNLNTTRVASNIVSSLVSRNIKEHGCNYSVNANKTLLGIMSFNPVTPVPQVNGADLENNKFDSFRSVVASIIAEFSDKSADEILGLLEVPKNSEHGDIAIAIPRLRVQGNSVQIAQQWAEKVLTNYILFLILI